VLSKILAHRPRSSRPSRGRAYFQLDTDILDSALWCEPPETIVIFLTLLLMADPPGFVAANPTRLAGRSCLPLPLVRHALKNLVARAYVKRVKFGYVVMNIDSYRYREEVAT
jgi:hypothetical protein